MTPVTYTNLNKLLLIRDIQEIAKTYINNDRSYRWIFLFIATYSNTQV